MGEAHIRTACPAYGQARTYGQHIRPHTWMRSWRREGYCGSSIQKGTHFDRRTRRTDKGNSSARCRGLAYIRPRGVSPRGRSVICYNRRMFWADRIVGEILDTKKPRDGKHFLIRDEKTMSGRVHVGSMRGVAIHGLVAEVLSEKGVANEYRYELNDFDTFDSIPSYLDEVIYREHLGKPLYVVPSPSPGFANYAEYFGAEFVAVHKQAGFVPEYYRATELYRSG